MIFADIIESHTVFTEARENMRETALAYAKGVLSALEEKMPELLGVPQEFSGFAPVSDVRGDDEEENYTASARLPTALALLFMNGGKDFAFAEESKTLLLLLNKKGYEGETLEEALQNPAALAFCAGFDDKSPRLKEAKRNLAASAKACPKYPADYERGRQTHISQEGLLQPRWLHVDVVPGDSFLVRCAVSTIEKPRDLKYGDWANLPVAPDDSVSETADLFLRTLKKEKKPKPGFRLSM